MKQIIIKEPYIKEEKDVSRLEAIITGPDFEKIHFFEVQAEYKQYLCYERSDAFVVSLLYFALVNGYDIKCTAPMSEKLYYNLSRVLIPTMVKYRPDFFHTIKIEAELDPVPIKNDNGIGAAVSGGVDSFYTIVTNMDTETKDYDITHLLVANSYNIFMGDADTRKRFKVTAEHSQMIADDLKLPLIKMYSNHSEFWFQRYQNIFCAKYASYPYALQKLFSVYYFSSGYEYSDFSIAPHDWDSSHYDAFTAPQLSSENFTFILSGAWAGRTEKMIRIVDNPVVQKRLQVCNLHQENCSICAKCMRTQFNLYATNKLELFGEAFKIDEFYKQKNKTLIRMLSVKSIFDKDNLVLMEKNNIEIPLKVQICGKFGRVYYLFRQTLKRIPVALKIYKLIKKGKPNSDLIIIERYNMDKEFAKTCDSGII